MRYVLLIVIDICHFHNCTNSLQSGVSQRCLLFIIIWHNKIGYIIEKDALLSDSFQKWQMWVQQRWLLAGSPIYFRMWRNVRGFKWKLLSIYPIYQKVTDNLITGDGIWVILWDHTENKPKGSESLNAQMKWTLTTKCVTGFFVQRGQLLFQNECPLAYARI